MSLAFRNKVSAISDKIYPMLLCIMGISITTSNFMMNLIWVLLSVNWLLGGNFKQKWQTIKQNHLLHAYLVLFGLYLVSLLWTNNLHQGLTTIRQMLPVLLVPLVVLTSPSLTISQTQVLRTHYVGTVVVVSIIGFIRYLVVENIPYREIVPFISHIRFSLNICFSICLLMYEVIKGSRTWERIMSLFFTIWLFLFLLLIQSYTGIFVLLVVALVIAIISKRKMLIVMSAALWLSIGLISGYYIYDYYHLRTISSTNPVATLNGRPYVLNGDDFIESGGYIHRYVCPEEMYQEWPKHSNMSLDAITENGYSVYSTLLRYLNAKDYTKDSLGICQLSPVDIDAIERGVANPAYLKQGSLKKFFSVILYEFETKRQYNAVQNFTMLERFELWKSGIHIVLQHPVFGVGVGDVIDQHQHQLAEQNSILYGTSKHIHNQYITWFAMFGIVGVLLLVFFFVRSFNSCNIRRNLLAIAYLTIILVSCVSEDLLDTLAGRMFFVFFVCFLVYPNVSISYSSKRN